MSKEVYRTTFWALCDQAIVSGGNFATNLALIRSLSTSSYGAYALLLNAVLFLNNLHTNMVAYPVCMRGAQSDEQGLKVAATGGLLATTAGTVVSAALLAAACISIQRPSMIPIVLGATLFWQLQETLRTVFVSRLAYKRAVAGDAVSYLGQAAVVAAICWRHTPSLYLVFAVVLGTSLAAAVGQGIQIRPARVASADLRIFFSELWRLGKWSTLAKIAAFFTFQAFPWLLAFSSGLPAVAAFQALFQLVALANPVQLGFNNLIIASIAGQHRNGRVSSWSAAAKQMRLAALLLCGYFAVLALFGRFFMQMMYGSRSPYLANAHLLRYFAIAYSLEAAAMIGGAVLAGLGETRFNFIAQLCAMGTSIVIVFPWILHSGLKAAVLGLIGVAATRAAANWYLVRLALQRKDGRPCHSPAALAGIGKPLSENV